MCAVPEASALPMVHSADLMQALLALTDAPRKTLKEPEGGYTIGGFSFTPADLVTYLRSLDSPHSSSSSSSSNSSPSGAVNSKAKDASRRNPWQVVYDASGTAGRFATLWPDSLSGAEAKRDLGWAPELVPTMEAAVDRIVAAHRHRATRRAAD